MCVYVCVCVQNACNDGVAMVAGNLNDGPASLASVLITLAQSFSMNTLGSLHMWLNTISSEVDELAVSKHTSQVRQVYSTAHIHNREGVRRYSCIMNLPV